jgi:hypothetical protein
MGYIVLYESLRRWESSRTTLACVWVIWSERGVPNLQLGASIYQGHPKPSFRFLRLTAGCAGLDVSATAAFWLGTFFCPACVWRFDQASLLGTTLPCVC